MRGAGSNAAACPQPRLSSLPRAGCPPEDWTGPLDLETADFEEWTDEERDSPIDVFRDDREPWEDIVLQELSELGPEEEEAAWASQSVGAGAAVGWSALAGGSTTS